MMAPQKNRIKGVIDRIEEGKVIILLKGEDESMILEKKYLPSSAKEGDIITIKIAVEENRTKKAKEEALTLIKRLKKS